MRLMLIAVHCKHYIQSVYTLTDAMCCAISLSIYERLHFPPNATAITNITCTTHETHKSNRRLQTTNGFTEATYIYSLIGAIRIFKLKATATATTRALINDY